MFYRLFRSLLYFFVDGRYSSVVLLKFNLFPQLSQKKNPDGIYPLRHAVGSLCADNLIAILKPNEESFTPLCDDHFVATQYSAIINEKSDRGNNYLHLLGYNITENNYAELSKMIMALLVNGCNVNLPNEQQETPFYLLLKNPLVDNSLLNFVIDNVQIDYYTHNTRDIEMLVKERGLAARMGQKIDFTVDTNYMVQHLDDWNDTQLVDNLERWKRDTKELDDGIMELLEAAVVKNLPGTVRILMDLGQNINGISKNSKFKMTPGFLACTFGHHRVLKVLLANKNWSFQSTSLQRNLLHQIFSSEVVDLVDRQKTFDLIIADRRCTLDVINQPDSENRVPLLFACLCDCDDIVKELLRRGAYIGYESVLNNIKKETLEEFLDECVKCSGDINDRDCEIYMEFKFLTPPDGNKTEIAPVHLICGNSKLKEFILHPVIASFVLLKWRKIDFIVYFNLLVYFGFMIFLGYTIVDYHNVVNDVIVKSNSTFLNNPHDGLFPFKLNDYVLERRSTYTSDTENNHKFDIIRKYEQSDSYKIVIYGLSMMAAYEVFQCAMSYKKYFFKPTNWLDILLVLFSFFALVGNRSYEYSCNRFKIICVMMILLIGAQSIQLLSKVSAFSLSLHMAILNRVCRTFLKTIGPYLIFITAFGMSFFALNSVDQKTCKLQGETISFTEEPYSVSQNETKGFSDPFISTISIIRMMLADFSVVNITKDDTFQGILFIAFMMSISIVLLNLLNALAISDTNRIMEVAEFVETKKRISTLRSYDKLFLKVTFVKVFPKLTTIMITPNKDSFVKVRRRLQMLDNVTILMQKTGKFSKFEYLYDGGWTNTSKPVTFDEKFINKILNFVKDRQQKDMDKINQELCELRAAQEDIRKELLKITSQYKPSHTEQSVD
ncbi:hypothetical protein HA402_000164 [Bradysia odoriphaga]|nr:hypothetical protein HA402_000164 [Bradysia odoriphaga]